MAMEDESSERSVSREVSGNASDRDCVRLPYGRRRVIATVDAATDHSAPSVIAGPHPGPLLDPIRPSLRRAGGGERRELNPLARPNSRSGVARLRYRAIARLQVRNGTLDVDSQLAPGRRPSGIPALIRHGCRRDDWP